MVTMAEGNEPSVEGEKTNITLYEFYAICISKLIEKSPWELERAVSAYHESFLTEQRCLGLAILVLLGEEHVPAKHLKEGMPGFEDQTRASVNQAIFLRALTHYFEQKSLNPSRAVLVLERMGGYITDSRKAEEHGIDALEAMAAIVMKRVPPKGDEQREKYLQRVGKIYDYIEGLLQNNILLRYNISG